MIYVPAVQVVAILSSQRKAFERTATLYVQSRPVELPPPQAVLPLRLFHSRKVSTVPPIVVGSFSSVSNKTPALVGMTPIPTALQATRDHVRMHATVEVYHIFCLRIVTGGALYVGQKLILEGNISGN